jgi:hypothetical protein
MPELNLAACPICRVPDNLVRQTRILRGQTYAWYECRACGSVLLSLGGDVWAYQKIGRQDQAHLLRKPLRTADLRELLLAKAPRPAAAPAVPPVRVPSGQPPARVAKPPSPQLPVRARTPPAGQKRRSRLAAGVLALLGLALLLIVVFVAARLVVGNEPLAAVPTAAQATQTWPATYTPLPPTNTPTPRPTATWVPTFTPLPPSPTPTLDPQLLRGLDDIQAQVVGLRGLEETRPITRTFLTTQDLFAYAQGWVDAEYGPGELEAEARTLAALGFVPRNFDLRHYLVSFYASQVAGFYDYTAKTLYIVSNLRDNKLPPLTQMSFAHEYAHGLEDQHFDLGAFLNGNSLDQDHQLARQTLVEGSATLLMDEYYLTLELSDQDLLDILIQVLSSDPDALSAAPGEIESMVMFPYTAGASFVATLYNDGGWEAVDAAFADPPQSTEQILHPDRYLVRDEPVVVSLPSLVDSLGSDWSLVSTDTLGEHELSLHLAQILSDDQAIVASEGWDGDRYALYARGDDDVLVLSTTWDSPADRDEFVQAYEQFAEAKYGQPASGTEDAQAWWDTPQQALILGWSDSGATVVLAPDMATATAVAATLLAGS